MSPEPEPRGRSDGSDATASFETGRYLYCVVEDEPGVTLEDTAGVGGGDVTLVRDAGFVVATHPCRSLFDSDDVDTVRRWLLQHQTVVDRMGEAFGTPLPFRFDTVLQGDDAAVRAWLRTHEPKLSDALDSLAGTWEYRIEVSWDESTLGDRLASDDSRLAELRRKRDEASDGRSFLVGKQYDRRLAEVKAAHRQGAMDDLRDRLRPLVDRLEASSGSGSTDLGSETRADDDRVRNTLTVLAREAHESELGDRLEDFASRPGVEVRFTGPWPPYSFAPSLGGEP
ncbi:gas vesicle protein GvpFL [Salinigranum rubrum]|uniref:Gas vesicle protein GvpFL n=1 Tax=Salinigranum rubrum TaxID=755307 RepID=A0A2I8VKJ9_9EURY|nr:GvpL/GvpF family gas vesicle protein [Salinigranum rubrum]AUV82448.1 gas vesicle protein GvpFL [Salinigranum rubrum]